MAFFLCSFVLIILSIQMSHFLLQLLPAGSLCPGKQDAGIYTVRCRGSLQCPESWSTADIFWEDSPFG